MKDFVLPSYDWEERKKILGGLKPNDVLVYFYIPRWEHHYQCCTRKVVRITPKGYVRLDSGELLKEYMPTSLYVYSEDIQNLMDKVKLENELHDLLSKMRNAKRNILRHIEEEDAKELVDILRKYVKEEEISK